MRHEDAALKLAELGNITRLAIFRLLIKSGHSGLSVGGIQRNIGIPASTLSHHISRLVSAGLVRQEKESRTIMCYAEYASLDEIIKYLKEECCKGVDEEI